MENLVLISYQRLAERSESMTNIFEQIKSKVTARQAAEYYGLKVERNGMACCPFHDDKHPSMKIDQNYYCFGCGAKGDATNYVAEMFGLSQFEAAKKMIQDMHLPIEIKKACKREMPRSIENRKEQEDAQIDEIKKRFQKWCADREQLFFDSINMIQAVKEDQKNKEPESIMNDEAFAVLLHAEPKLDYWIEILCFGTEEEKKEFFLQNQREVKELEGKIFRAGKTILDRNWEGIKQRMCG